MRQNRQHWCVTVASVLVMFFSSGLSRAQDTDPVLRNRLVLPDLIQEVLVRNPELVAARKQWEVATNRITQARSLDDPILSVQLWNIPQPFKATQADNTIFGLSQNLPFPGKLALKGDVASRSAEMTEQVVRAKERELVARLKQAYYDLFLAQKAVQIHHEQVELLRQFVEIANAKFRAGHGKPGRCPQGPSRAVPAVPTSSRPGAASQNSRSDAEYAARSGLPHHPWAWRKNPLNCHSSSPSTICTVSRYNDRPELKAAELDVQRSEQSRALAQRQYYPDFNVAFQRFQNYQANDGFGAYVAMSIPFAFWTKPKYDAGVQEAEAAVSVAQAQQHTLENLTRFQINDLLAKLRATDQVATLYRTTILPQAEQSLESARVGYRAGKGGFLDLIDAQRAWRGFQLEYFKALVDRQHRLAELEQVVGITLDRQS